MIRKKYTKVRSLVDVKQIFVFSLDGKTEQLVTK